MNPDLITSAIFIVAALALLFTKTNVAFVTFALCSGFVLSFFLGPDVYSLFTENDGPDVEVAWTIINLTMLLFPALLVWFHFRKSQKGSGRFLMQLLPALSLALLFAVLIFEVLPEGVQANLEENSIIHGQMKALRNWLVGLAIGASLMDIMLQHGGQKRPYKKRKKIGKD